MNLTDFCNQWLSAWTGNKPELLLSFYSIDAYYSDPANTTGLQGHEQLLTYFQKLLKHNPSWKWSALEIISTEKGFTLKWKAEIPINGNTVSLVGLDIVELTKGKISRNEVYFDRTGWLNAIKGS